MIKLVIAKSEELDKNFLKSAKEVKDNIIFVLSSKPYYSIQSKVEKVCNKKSCLFLDTIKESSNEEVIYLPAENLTALSIAINQGQQTFKGKVTVIFDSIANLSIKNDVATLIKFFSFLIYRTRDWGVDLVIVIPKEGVDEKLLSIIKQSADKIEKR